MATNRILAERRRFRRFHVPQGAFILCPPNSHLSYHILDISKGGLSFSYLDGERGLDQASELDIFCCDSEFCLTDLPFATVSDVRLPVSQTDGVPLFRRGVKFKGLIPDQQSLLEYFIESATLPLVNV